MLLMTSVLYNEDDKKSLPEGRTKLYEDLYEFMMDRSTLKPNNFGCYSSEVRNLQDMLQTLGRFAWEALQNDVRQLFINKVEIISNSSFPLFLVKFSCFDLKLENNNFK